MPPMAELPHIMEGTIACKHSIGSYHYAGDLQSCNVVLLHFVVYV